MLLCQLSEIQAEDITLKITKKYLNLPVSQQIERKNMTFIVKGKPERTFSIRLTATPEYWVFCDVSPLKGQSITIRYDGDATGLSKIYQADEIEGQQNLYREANRPQFHFTTRRGWNNDPNGLIYYEGEYHLFYQHNPYEREWENMHWGHAVSRDLLHWEELPVALSPDHLGTIFSGTAVIDADNTSGFGKKGTPPMVAIYTANGPAKQVQCLAYSLDKGRTWTKYDGNPVIDSGEKWNTRDTRDPKVFWHQASEKWVMALNERDGHSVYTSSNLKEWAYQSHVTGFWECPDLFELPVDNHPENTKWVMYGASGTYMIGAFDGKTFTPQLGKFSYTTGTLYAAQTFENIPASDGRRIQIGWGRVQHPDMPFNGMMLLPTELTLRTTPNGIRMFSNPVKEIDRLQEQGQSWRSLTVEEANELLKPYHDAGCLRIKFTFKLSHATSAGLNLAGQSILNYDLNFNKINDVFYSPADITSAELTADILIDKTSVEVFIDGGAYSFSMERKSRNSSGFQFWGNNPLEVKTLEVYPMKSIWQEK
ncbi:MAG: glycoside hydrolase family 32 protein [Bacteroidales bacterium]|nr:glycoside hydrolase family 32 protein [Bacteroidales bacterium]